MSDKPISPLCQRVINDMTARRFSEKVQNANVRRVRTFAAFLSRSPDAGMSGDLRRFQLRMVQQQISPGSINAAIAALRFFFTVPLERPDLARHLTTVHKPRRVLVHRFLETDPVRGIYFSRHGLSRCCLIRKRGFLVMAGLRRAIELAIGEEDLAALRAIARSRTEPARRVERARMVWAYREDPSFFAVGRALGVHHQTVERFVERALAYGPMAALDDRARPGKEPTITAEAKAWLVSLACRKAKDLGYPHELWTTRLLARHAREHGPAEGQACLGKLAQGTLCKILNEQEVKPHKVRTYLERRDPEFKQKMAEVLCVTREGKILKESAAQSKTEPSDAVAIVSYDEKPGIQAIATMAPDLPSKPGRYATLARTHTSSPLSLLRIDLLTDQIHALVKTATAAANSSNSSSFSPPIQPHGDQVDPRQSFGAHLQGDQGLARQQPTGRFRIHLHPQARLVAQSRRGLLLQARPLGAAPYPRRIQTGTQGPHHGRHGSLQSRPRRPHLVLQARPGRLI